ncbi:FimD/PapC N-terminal domain-containing protein, partial [Escherichia coli]
VDSFPALKMSPPEACVAFDEIIPQATSRFDFNTQTLHLSFPQAAMMMTARGTVDPSRWDEGIPALLLDYSFSGSNGRNEGTGSSSDSASDSYYLNLRSGLNVGPWRLRNNSIWN